MELEEKKTKTINPDSSKTMTMGGSKKVNFNNITNIHMKIAF